jgi:hypothetical protein
VVELTGKLCEGGRRTECDVDRIMAAGRGGGGGFEDLTC